MANGNGLTPPGAPSGAPPPGIDICQGCPDIANCERQVAQGLIPSCAGPNGSNTVNAPGVNSSSGKPAGTNPFNNTATGNTPIGTPGPLTGVGQFFATLGQQLGLIVVGLVLVGTGFYLMFSKQIQQVGKKAVEIGAVA